jgi:hypothetical protein
MENFTPLGTHFDSCKSAMNVGLNSNLELRNPIGTSAILLDFHWIRPFWTSLDLIWRQMKLLVSVIYVQK